MTDCTPSAEAMNRDVHTWLDRGGHLLEMEVASLICEFDPDYLESGYHYFDRATGVEREGDVHASLALQRSDDSQHSFDLVIECKNTTAPWVFFVGKSIGGTTPWEANRGCDDACRECLLLPVAVSKALATWDRAYAVKEKRSSKGIDSAYEGVQQAASALLGLFDPEAKRDSHTKYGAMTHGRAFVVTRSPLFTCTLDSDGTPHLERVEVASIATPRPSLLDPQIDGVEVTVLSPAGLRTVLERLTSGFNELPRPDFETKHLASALEALVVPSRIPALSLSEF